MTELGGLVRIDGRDADALGPEFEEEARRFAADRVAAAEGPFHEEKSGTRYGPSTIRRSRRASSSSGSCTPSRPSRSRAAQGAREDDAHRAGLRLGPVLVDDVRRSVLGVPGVKDVDVELVFDPPWDPSRMSEAAGCTSG